jgi:hypothetical protein
MWASSSDLWTPLSDAVPATHPLQPRAVADTGSRPWTCSASGCRHSRGWATAVACEGSSGMGARPGPPLLLRFPLDWHWAIPGRHWSQFQCHSTAAAAHPRVNSAWSLIASQGKWHRSLCPRPRRGSIQAVERINEMITYLLIFNSSSNASQIKKNLFAVGSAQGCQ